MTRFLNYVNGNLSINTCREPTALVTDLDDLVVTLSRGKEDALVVTLYGDELALLEDATYWQGSAATKEVLEQVHSLITQDSQP